MKKMLVFIAILVMIISMFSVNALMIKKTTWGFNALTGQIGFPTAFPKFPTIKPVCSDTDASPDYALIGIPAPEVQQNNADLFVRGQATGVFQSTTLPQITGENPNKCSQRFLDPSATYSTFMDCCSDSKTLTEAFCKGSTGPFSIQIPCKYGCKDGVCLSTPQEVCTDTDNGKAYDVKGVTTAFDGYQQTDVCHSPTPTKSCSGPDCYLSEYYCTEGLMVGEENLVCPVGCQDGACIKATAPYCTDSDNGKVFDVKGFVSTNWPGWNASVPVPDKCAVLANAGNYVHNASCSGNNCYLIELWCSGATPMNEIKQCSNCVDGACVSASVCTDSDGGLNMNTFGWTDFKVGSFESRHPDACALVSSYDSNGVPQAWRGPDPGQEKNWSCSGADCYVEEAFCRIDEKGNFIDADADQLIKCPYGCKDGACVSAPPGQSCTRVFKFANNEGIEYTLNLLVSPSSVRIMPSPTGIAGETLHFYEGKTSGNIAIPEYFVLTAKPSPRFTHIFQYTGFGGGQLKFTDLGTGNREIPFTSTGNTTGVANLVAGGKTYRIYVNTSTGQLLIDQNADGLLNGEQAEIVDNTGKVYNQEYFTENPCAVPVVPQPPVVLPPPPVVEPQPQVVIPQPPVEQVSERVTCMFRGSRAAQKCYSLKGACSGKMFCVVAVTGARGEKVSWKSSCGGEATTVMDGRSDSAVFTCRR